MIIEQFKPDAIVSLHEGPQDGFFVIAENNVPQSWGKAIYKDLKSEGVSLTRKNFFGLNVTKSFWRKPRYVYILQKLMGIYTLGRYAYEHNIPLLTTESSWTSKNLTARKKAHVLTVKAVIGADS